MDKKNKSSKYRQIKAIENEYGAMVFNCGLVHLVSCGTHVLGREKEVIACKVKIENETSAHAIMTADFQCDIIDCAVKLASIDVWDLFRYIQTDVPTNGWCEE